MAFSSDEFGTPTAQNMLPSDGAKSFNWYLMNSTAADVVTVDSTNAGKLTIDTNASDTGFPALGVPTCPVVYQLVAGDFDIETAWTDNSDAAAEQGGICVLSDADTGLRLYLACYFSASPTMAARSTTAAVDTILGTDVALAHRFVRITRVGNVFTLYRKASAGNSWTQHGQVTRSDLGSTVRVGVWAAPNNVSNNFVAQYEYFRVGGAALRALLGVGI